MFEKLWDELDGTARRRRQAEQARRDEELRQKVAKHRAEQDRIHAERQAILDDARPAIGAQSGGTLQLVGLISTDHEAGPIGKFRCNKRHNYVAPINAELLRGDSLRCKKCRKRGRMVAGRRTMVYVLKLPRTREFKIGITQISIEHRYQHFQGRYEILLEHWLPTPAPARRVEKAALDYHRDHEAISDKRTLDNVGGSTELVVWNPVEIVRDLIEKEETRIKKRKTRGSG